MKRIITVSIFAEVPDKLFQEFNNRIFMPKKFIYHPFIRILIGLLVVTSFGTAGQVLSQSFLKNIHMGNDYKNLITAAAVAALASLSYIVLFRFYEKRQITEMKFSRFGKNAGIGFLTGFVLQSLVILVIFIGGGYSVIKSNQVSFIIPGLAIALSSAIFEEILFRGIIFRIVEEKWGSIIALVVSALIFGFLHIFNKNASIYSTIAIAAEAGILLAAAYIYAKNLWLPIFLHFAWNFAEAGIYGAVISGNVTNKSLFTAKFSGPQLLTGGAFGPENSLQAVLFCLGAALLFILAAKRGNKIVKISR